MIPQPDGTKESKPTIQRPRLHQRIASILCTKKSDTSSEEFNSNEEVDDTSPMRALSPRATAYDPSSPRRTGRTTSLRNRWSKSPEQATTTRPISGTVEDKKEGGADIDMSDGSGLAAAHAPVVDGRGTKSILQAPVRGQIQFRKETVGTSVGLSGIPESPMREAALTSHPAGRGESDSSEGKFETPMEESGNDEYLDRK